MADLGAVAEVPVGTRRGVGDHRVLAAGGRVARVGGAGIAVVAGGGEHAAGRGAAGGRGACVPGIADERRPRRGGPSLARPGAGAYVAVGTRRAAGARRAL